MIHIMLDLETMGTEPNSAIIAIGAVSFNNEVLIDQFYSIVSLESCCSFGMKVSPNTIMWWLDQSQAARDEFKRIGLPIEVVLPLFSTWVNKYKNPWVWGNGSDFDNTIITSCYKTVGAELPWKYNQNRCYRTISAIFKDKVPKPINHAKHNALEDARVQAMHLLAINRAVNLWQN